MMAYFALIGRLSAGARLLSSFGLVLAIWTGAGYFFSLPDTVLPTPLQVWQAACGMAQSGLLWGDLLISLQRAATGFVVGSVAGIVMGLFTGRSRLINLLIGPLLNLLRPVPAIALIPLAIVWFGIGEGSKYFVIAYTVFLCVWFNTHHGMAYVPEIYLRASRTLGATRRREFFVVAIPSAAPYIVAGLRSGAALAFLSLVAAELSGASSGIGYRLQEARQYIATDRIFALLIELGMLGALLDAVLNWLGRRLIHWQQA